MTVDPSRPTDTPADTGTADGAGATATDQETPEQKALRERDEKIAELEQANRTQAGQLRAWQPKVEAMNQLERAVGSPGGGASASPTAPAGGTLDEMVQRLEAEYAQFPTAMGLAALNDYRARQQVARQQADFQRFLGEQVPQIEAHTDAEVKARALELIRTGQYGSAHAALAAATGEILQARSEAPNRKPKPTGKPPDTTTSDGAPPTGNKKMALSESLAIINAGGAAAAKHRRDRDNGLIEIDPTR